jgi:uncharacterized protein
MIEHRENVVGVISDTHGLLRPEARHALQGVEHILHAGDIGSQGILVELRSIAPTTAIRGNNDRDAWATRIPEALTLQLHGRRIHLVHSIADLDLDPATAAIDIIISGHSHKPSITHSGGVLYLNPGSAGPRRFSLPITVAKLFLSPDGVRAEIIPLGTRL